MISTPFITFVKGVGNWDSWDLYWYNNHEAEGVHNYPTGIHKYYDVFSWPGYRIFIIDYFQAMMFSIWSIVTLLPIDIWYGIFDKDMSNWSLAFMYYYLSLTSPFFSKYLFATLQV